MQLSALILIQYVEQRLLVVENALIAGENAVVDVVAMKVDLDSQAWKIDFDGQCLEARVAQAEMDFPILEIIQERDEILEPLKAKGVRDLII